MYIWTVLVLGIAANLDNLCIGISYGLAGRRIPWRYNLLMAMTSGLFAYIACSIALLVSQAYTTIALVFGSGLLVWFGLYTMIGAIRKRRKEADEEECGARDITLWEMMVLSVALALNCLLTSFGGGLSGVPAFWLFVSTSVFSLLFVALGNLLGVKINWVCRSKWLDVASGAMLVIIGIFEFFL